MESLLGLAGYDSDHSDDRAHEETRETSPTSQPQQGESSAGQKDNEDITSSASVAIATAVAGEGLGEGEREGEGEGGGGIVQLPEDSNSRLPEDSNSLVVDDGGNVKDGAVSSFDAPAPPPSRESRPVFMPLPSPLVRVYNASTASPFIPFDPPNDGGVIDEKGVDGEDEKDDEGDGDIILPKYRDMLPPEATGPANPKLQAKIAKFLKTMVGDYTKVMKGKKDYGNPAVLAQICEHCNVDDKGTNYPKDRMIHPSVYDTRDFHDSLMAEFRRADRPRKEKARQQQVLQQQAPAQATVIAKAGAPLNARVATGTTAVRGSSDTIVHGANAATPVLPTAGTTRKRGNKWGSVVPTLSGALPTTGRATQLGATEATASAAGQAALIKAHTQAAQVAKDAQQRAEAIAKLQVRKEDGRLRSL